MAATRINSGVAREVWLENVFQIGGAAQTFVTGIRVKRASDVSRLRGILFVTTTVGAPLMAVAVAINANNFIAVTVTNAAGGGAANEARWVLDIQLLHTLEQANDATAAAAIPVVNTAQIVQTHELTHVNGGTDEIRQPVRDVAVNDNVLATDFEIRGSSGGAGIALQLPTAVGIAGRRYVIRKVDAPAFPVTITALVGEFLDGVLAVLALGVQWETAEIVSNGVGWDIVSHNVAPAAHEATHLNAGADEVLRVPTVPGVTPYAVLAADELVLITTGGVAYVANLYAALAAAAGRRITLMKVDAGIGAVAVTPNVAETINGVAAPVALAAQWDSVTLEIIGLGAWVIVAQTP